MLTTSLGMLKRLNLQKNPEAWESFVNLYGPLILRWNIKAGLTQEDAKDVSQEVLLQVFRSVHTFERRSKGSFRGWLNRINYVWYNLDWNVAAGPKNRASIGN